MTQPRRRPQVDRCPHCGQLIGSFQRRLLAASTSTPVTIHVRDGATRADVRAELERRLDFILPEVE